MIADIQIVERNKGPIVEGIAFEDIPIGSLVTPYCGSGSDPNVISFKLNTTILSPSWFVCLSNIYGESLSEFKAGDHIRCLCMVPGDISHVRVDAPVIAGTFLISQPAAPGTATTSGAGWYAALAIANSQDYDFGDTLTKVLFG